MNDKRTKRLYIENKKQILKGFCVSITPEVTEKLEELYPREIAIENYIKSLIKARLESEK